MYLKIKITRVDLKDTYSDYNGGPSYENAVKYITDLFKSQIPSFRKEFTYFEYITAIDSDNVRECLDNIIDHIEHFSKLNPPTV